MYKENDYLVYGKDICQVEKIEKQKFNNEDYYILRPIRNKSLKISAPMSDKAGKIRSLITKEEIEYLISKIPSLPIIEADDKLMESEYKKLLNDIKEFINGLKQKGFIPIIMSNNHTERIENVSKFLDVDKLSNSKKS